MITVLEYIFSCDSLISVFIQLPKATVEYIKVFIRKVPRHLVNVFFIVNLLKGFEKIGPSNLTQRDAPRMTFVHSVKDSSNDSDGIFFLEFRVIG